MAKASKMNNDINKKAAALFHSFAKDWNLFKDTYTDKTKLIAGVKTYIPKIKHEKIDNKFLKLSLSEPAVMTNWPISPSRGDCTERSASLHIAVKGWVKLSLSRDNLDSYSINVCYLKKKVGGSKVYITPLQSYHYDMDLNSGLGHPLFHAQAQNPLSQEEMLIAIKAADPSIEDKHLAPSDNKLLPLKNTRIPTARFDLTSIFIALFADHFLGGNQHRDAPEAFKELLDQAAKKSLSIPLGTSLFTHITNNDRHLNCACWYTFCH